MMKLIRTDVHERSMTLPNPYEPLNLHEHGTYRVRQRERRAAILAATRIRMAEVGHERVTVRAIADMSGITAQTVYNLVGDRTLMLSEAIVDHIEALGDFAHSRTDINFLMALVDTYWLAAEANPAYMRQVAVGYFQLHRGGIRRIDACERILLRRGVRTMQGGCLRTGFHPHWLINGASKICAANFFAWACGAFDLGELRNRLMVTGSLLLAGAIAAEEARRMEAWLRDRTIAGAPVADSFDDESDAFAAAVADLRARVGRVDLDVAA